MNATIRTIDHGIPQGVRFFGIMQPCYEKGGLDCSSIGDGIGLVHHLKNPVTKTLEPATLIHRRTCYTDSPTFESFALMIYGKPAAELLEVLRERYEGLIPEIMEVWVFEKQA